MPGMATAEEITIADVAVGSLPKEFSVARTGKGREGQWAVVQDPQAPGGRALEQDDVVRPGQERGRRGQLRHARPQHREQRGKRVGRRQVPTSSASPAADLGRADVHSDLREHDHDEFDRVMAGAVADTVRKQVEIGIDIVSDGETSKIGYATYIKDRLTGFEGDNQHP